MLLLPNYCGYMTTGFLEGTVSYTGFLGETITHQLALWKNADGHLLGNDILPRLVNTFIILLMKSF